MSGLIQTRPKDLDLYVQLDVGDVGYVDPTELVYIVDHSTFAKPKRFPFTSVAAGAGHYEQDKLIGLSSKTVSVTFATAFADVPKIETFKVYRMKEVVSGEWRMVDVLYSHSSASWLLSTGFSLTIHISESLTGVIIEYKFV